MSEERNRWISHIKQLRHEHDVGLFEAERIALAEPEWRRWVERQINSDIKCRKAARSHMQMHGPASLIYQDGDALKVR
jgi:hypothetical protein